MTAITEDTLKILGLSTEELTEKLVDRMAEQLLTELVWDEDGNEYRKGSGLKQRLMNTMTKHIDASVNKLADEHVLPKVTEIIEGLVLHQTNAWGEKRGEPITFIEYLIQRAESYMREEVNYEGKTRSENSYGSWSKSGTRVAYMVDKHLHYSIERAMTQALADANKSIAGGINDAVKIGLQNALAGLKVGVTVKS